MMLLLVYADTAENVDESNNLENNSEMKPEHCLHNQEELFPVISLILHSRVIIAMI